MRESKWTFHVEKESPEDWPGFKDGFRSFFTGENPYQEKLEAIQNMNLAEYIKRIPLRSAEELMQEAWQDVGDAL